ncbi:hypothetical protein [Sphingomonas sp. KR3-1]|uniref:hypothetical protein n=1 Tax=Sphingomonas sp. KR3-1 TaxID=3156611 RepID=UPI0032B36294
MSKEKKDSDTESARDWFRRSRAPITRAHVLWLLMGIGGFLLGTVVQLMPARYPELTHLLEQCDKLPDACRAAVLAFDVQGHRESALTYPTIFGDLLRSLSAAVVISILITLTVESRSRREFDELLTAKTRELGMSVFHGMFNRDHPVALLDAVKQQILERSLIRDHLDVSYTFSEVEAEPAPGYPKEKFIKVDVLLSSETTNVSTLHGDAGRADAPLAMLLPNPQIPDLKQLVRVHRFVVNGTDVPKEALETANDQLQAALADDGNIQGRASFGDRSIEPGESVAISASYTMVKELEDTEVFRSLQICRSLSLTVVDNTALNLHIQARGIHPGTLTQISTGNSTKQWRISNIVLPQQGIMLFWKRQRTANGKK